MDELISRQEAIDMEELKRSYAPLQGCLVNVHIKDAVLEDIKNGKGLKPLDPEHHKTGLIAEGGGRMSDDTISRQAAKNAIRQAVTAYKVSLESPFLNNREKEDLRSRKSQALEDMVAIETLPSAKHQGEWIETLLGWQCSVCGEEQNYSVYFKHCPNCGALMMDEGKDE